MRGSRPDRRSLRVTLLAVGCLGTAAAAAQQAVDGAPPVPAPIGANGIGLGAKGAPDAFDWMVRAGVTVTDNVNRTDADKLSDTIPEVGLRLSVNENRPNLQTKIESDLEYQDYTKHTYPNEVIGGLAGTALFSAIPDRLAWAVQDNFGQTRANALAAETPANRQNVNVFTTGPDVALPLDTQTSIALQARWTKSSFGQDLADNEQELGTLSLIRKLSAETAVSINVSHQHVGYDQDIPGEDNDYNVDSAYFGVVAGGPRTTLNLDAGATVLHDFEGDKTAPLVHLAFSRLLTPRTRLVIDGGTNFSDAAQVFRVQQAIGGIVIGGNDVIVGSDPLRSDYGALMWIFAGARTRLQLGIDAERERHERNFILDREREGGSLNITHRLSPTVDLLLVGVYGRQDFQTSNLILKDWLASASVAWQISRNFSLVGRVARGVGTSGEVVAYNYTENRASLFLQYGRKH
jgi:hypothetical protein